MSIAYAVTQFEVFIQSSLIQLINEDTRLMENAQKNIKDLSTKSIKFKKLTTDTIKHEVNSYLLDQMFHNIPKTKNIVSSILGRKIQIDITHACKVMDIRHDIIHRGGLKKDGDTVRLTKNIALETLNHIRQLGDSFQSEFINV